MLWNNVDCFRFHWTFCELASRIHENSQNYFILSWTHFSLRFFPKEFFILISLLSCKWKISPCAVIHFLFCLGPSRTLILGVRHCPSLVLYSILYLTLVIVYPLPPMLFSIWNINHKRCGRFRMWPFCSFYRIVMLLDRIVTWPTEMKMFGQV